MPLWNIFTGPTPEKLEARGDAHAAAGRWGMAKLEYERALEKRTRRPEAAAPREASLAAKIRGVCEALAREHRQNAARLLEGGRLDDARELLELARELTADPELGAALEGDLMGIAARRQEAAARAEADYLYGLDAPGDEKEDEEDEDPGDLDPDEAPEEDVFLALVSGLPEEVQEAYAGYGPDFQAGFTALHRGDFALAATLLARALEAHAHRDTYIPLELATAYLNLDRGPEARDLLEGFRRRHPGVLPAWQLICEIHWEAGELDAAEALLADLPPELARSLAATLLRGETLRRAGRPAEARDLYREVLAAHGWHEGLARALAEVLEETGDAAGARRLYRELMDRCTACRTQLDPAVRERYAELAFAAGDRDSALLELYLTLARDLPASAARSFARAAAICEHQGRAREAARFRALASRAATPGSEG